ATGASWAGVGANGGGRGGFVWPGGRGDPGQMESPLRSEPSPGPAFVFGSDSSAGGGGGRGDPLGSRGGVSVGGDTGAAATTAVSGGRGGGLASPHPVTAAEAPVASPRSSPWWTGHTSSDVRPTAPAFTFGGSGSGRDGPGVAATEDLSSQRGVRGGAASGGGVSSPVEAQSRGKDKGRARGQPNRGGTGGKGRVTRRRYGVGRGQEGMTFSPMVTECGEGTPHPSPPSVPEQPQAGAEAPPAPSTAPASASGAAMEATASEVAAAQKPPSLDPAVTMASSPTPGRLSSPWASFFDSIFTPRPSARAATAAATATTTTAATAATGATGAVQVPPSAQTPAASTSHGGQEPCPDPPSASSTLASSPGPGLATPRATPRAAPGVAAGTARGSGVSATGPFTPQAPSSSGSVYFTPASCAETPSPHR
ncbi:unnamed protein product, partial [Discosporangium mesarthrocarpum]